MSRISLMRWQTPLVSPLLAAIAVLGCVMLPLMGYHLGFLFFSLFTMLVLGVPIAVSLAGACLMFVLITGQVPNIVIAHRMINGIDSFPLLAIPFFIFAGSLMNNGGITERIFSFAKALMGWMRGGLGHVNVGASIVFSGCPGRP
jgi:TRAP-type mannitol/chloroaromatic compound transport system permease large subunit